MSGHPLENIAVKGGNKEEVKGLLRLLPDNTFKYAKEFIEGSVECAEDYCGQFGIYAKKAPALGDKGVMIVVINEHLFGDALDEHENPNLNIPEGATNIHLDPVRQCPLKNSKPYAGVVFDYEGARFFLGYELSTAAYKMMCKSIASEQKEHAD